MADSEGAGAPGPGPEAVLERVLDVVRALARETGGPRAERAVSAEASLEREVGLGSLERVELLARLERAFGRALDDRCLALDTAAGLARALVASALRPAPLRLPAREEALGVAADIGGGVRTLHESLWRHARLDPAPRPRLPAERPRIAHAGRGEPLPGRGGRRRGGDHLRPAPRRGGGGRGRPPRARRLPRRHRRPRCCRRASTSCAPSSASCSRARSRCRSTRPSASTGSRSTPPASPPSWPTPACACSSRSPARGPW